MYGARLPSITQIGQSQASKPEFDSPGPNGAGDFLYVFIRQRGTSGVDLVKRESVRHGVLLVDPILPVYPSVFIPRPPTSIVDE